jgi:hypothetical protein
MSPVSTGILPFEALSFEFMPLSSNAHCTPYLPAHPKKIRRLPDKIASACGRGPDGASVGNRFNRAAFRINRPNVPA